MQAPWTTIALAGAALLPALVGCAASGVVAGVAQPAPGGTDGAEAIDPDALGEFDLTELALLVSGYERQEELKTARAQLEVLARSAIEKAGRIADPEARAEALLAELHRGEPPILSAYDARATTLREIIEQRRFNCLSAAVLYAILAQRLGLDADAQLLPTHARAVVHIRRGAALVPVIVETTSPQGYDPDPRIAAQILEQVAGPQGDRGRALVPDEGVTVSNLVLIGAIYVNRASIAQEAGDLGLAARLFGRGESLAGDEKMKQVLRDQRAALLSQLGADDILSGERDRLARGYRTMKAAAALAPEVEAVRLAVLQNLRAAAERMIALVVPEGGEEAARAIVTETIALGLGEGDGAGLRAFYMSEVARHLSTRGDADGAVVAIERALSERLAGRDAPLKKTLEQNHVAALRLAAMTSAKSGDLARSLQIIERLQNVPGLSGEEREMYALDRKNALHTVAQKWLAEGDLRGSAEIYRQGLRIYPDDPTMRHNLIAVLERLALPAVGEGRCERAEEVLGEIAALDRSGSFSRAARLRCLSIRANERLKKGDHAEAVALLRAALSREPREALVRKNLGLALLRWAAQEAAEGRCLRALELTREIEVLEGHGLTRAHLERALGDCGP